jgi:hypothetical protein
MRNALVVAWKEFKTFFQTPIGYVILVVFTLYRRLVLLRRRLGQPSSSRARRRCAGC